MTKMLDNQSVSLFVGYLVSNLVNLLVSQLILSDSRLINMLVR